MYYNSVRNFNHSSQLNVTLLDPEGKLFFSHRQYLSQRVITGAYRHDGAVCVAADLKKLLIEDTLLLNQWIVKKMLTLSFFFHL